MCLTPPLTLDFMHASDSGSLLFDSGKLLLLENVSLSSGNRIPSSNFLFLEAIMRHFQHKTSLMTMLFPNQKEKAFASSTDSTLFLRLFTPLVNLLQAVHL